MRNQPITLSLLLFHGNKTGVESKNDDVEEDGRKLKLK